MATRSVGPRGLTMAAVVVLSTWLGCGAPAPAGALQSIAVTPANKSLGVGATQTFVATGSFTDGSTQNLTSQAVWDSSAPMVASIGASTGVASGLATGTATIRATFGGVTGSTPLNITTATLQSIAVTPDSSDLAVGAARPFLATGTYSDGSTGNITGSVTWASSAPAVASIDAAGVVTALTTGATTITAAKAGVTGSASLTISTKTLRSISVTPAAFSIPAGTTQQLVATGTYSDDSTQVITSSVTWTTANGSVATVGSSSGLVTGVSAGTGVAITAQLGSVTGSSQCAVTSAGVTLTGLTVDATTVFVNPSFRPFPNVCATFSNGTGSCPYGSVTWTSSNTAVAIVSDTQGVKALSPGTTTLTARSGTISGSNTLTVTTPVLNSIAVLPASPSIAAGTQLQMTARGSYSDGSQQNLTSGVTWSSGSSGVVSINGSGLATGLASGSSVITASASGRSGSTTATVPTTTPTTFTVVLTPVNDNTIASSSLSSTPENSVYQSNYWFGSPGIGMGCNLYYGVITHVQDISCARGLVKFNLTSLAGKNIQSATLSLTTSANGVGNYRDPWYVAASASPWAGSTVTWLNYGELTYTTSIISQIAAPTFVGQTYTFDETATVRNWVSGAFVNNGFAMGLMQEQLRLCNCDSIDLFEFHSSEDTSGRGPKLTVTYQ